jgi:phosphoglycerate dehydrogenase-like enzyme
MAKPRVLVSSYFLRPGDEVDQQLRSAGMETVFNRWHGGRTEEEMIDILQGIDGAILSIDPITERVLDACSKLKVVSRTGVGYDAIDVRAATSRGIAVCTAPGTNQNAVADWTMTLLLQCARKTVANLSEVKRGGWTRHEGRDLSVSTLGIVGLGQIGKSVARRARGFDMRVLAYDVVQDQAFAVNHQVTYVSLEQLLRESDYVTLHTFLDANTKRLMNAERIGLMKPTAHLINTARGGLVDEKALAESLRQRRIAGAALDVFDNEPLEADNPLRDLENAFLSPHAAGATKDTQDAMGRMAAENVILVLQGKKPLYAVNSELYR